MSSLVTARGHGPVTHNVADPDNLRDTFRTEAQNLQSK